MRLTLIQFSLFLSLFTCELLAQGTQVEFGKNRVQYHDFFDEWSQYDSDNFVTYWYGRSRDIGQSVVQMAEYDFNEIQRILEHRLNQKVEIIVYSDLTDLKQSNIGTEEVFTNTGGQTKIVGNIMFVYFNGDHKHLRRQIREGVAQVYLNSMLFGANIQEIVQNAVMLNLPNWFKTGLIDYIGESWNTSKDNELRNIMMSDEFENFESLADINPGLAGQSLWYFIAERYGRSTVSNLLYLTRINRSIESGFLYVLGNSYQTVLKEWTDFYLRRYEKDNTNRSETFGQEIIIKNKKNLPVSTVRLSPDGTKLVYVLNTIGKYKVYLYDLIKNERKLLFKEGFKNTFQTTDLNYPLISWNPIGNVISIIYEKRDRLILVNQDIFTDKQEIVEIPDRYQRIYSMDYVDPFRMVFSAASSGQGDIYLFNYRTRQSERITQDYYDDLDARYVETSGEKGILFSSNRTDTLLIPRKLDTILPINTFDLFYYSLDRDLPELVRITNTPLANERQPMQVDSTFFGYLSDRRGIYNREMAKLEDYVHHYEQKILFDDGSEVILHADSTLESMDTSLIDTIEIYPIIRTRAIAHINSDYNQNINHQHSTPQGKKLVQTTVTGDKTKIFLTPLQPELVYSPLPTQFHRSRIALLKDIRQATGSDVSERLDNLLKPLNSSDNNNGSGDGNPSLQTKEKENANFFQTEFGNPENLAIESEQEEKSNTSKIPEEEDPNLIPPISTFDFPVATNGKEKQVYKFRSAGIIPYRLQFRTNFITSQLDNSLLFEGMNSFVANPNDPFNPPNPGILLKAIVQDLFEDYEIEGGIRIPTSFDGAEYFVTFNDRKKRLDKRYSFYMRRQRLNNGTTPSRTQRRQESTILMGQYGVRYPLDVFRSLRATATLRQDRLVQLSTDVSTFNTPTISDQRIGLRLEYVFDNSFEVATNIRHGSRYKVWAESFKKFSVNTNDGLDVSFNDGFLTVLAMDVRHYQPILKHSILAGRLAAATSFGSERILYFLGGVDSWLFPAQNNDIAIPAGNYAFQSLAANMRGFRIGIRNGNSFALANTELRVPIFKYISKRISSSLLKNFQMVGFFDVGTAWVGKDPYREDNPLNTTSIVEGNDNIEVTVNYFRDPLVAGYGVGARTVLFGYFVRVDYAWGVETRVVQDPRLYISFGLDF
ncbi:MAG: hypothetical protein HRU40_04030 [Saprospiraceae bacterium]|nr:hypothetical protein [Saprospiraceae bacterium]